MNETEGPKRKDRHLERQKDKVEEYMSGKATGRGGLEQACGMSREVEDLLL